MSSNAVRQYSIRALVLVFSMFCIGIVMAQTKDQMKKYDDWFLFEDGRGNVESLIGFRHEDGTLSALHRVCNPAIVQCPWVFSPGSEVTCKKNKRSKIRLISGGKENVFVINCYDGSSFLFDKMDGSIEKLFNKGDVGISFEMPNGKGTLSFTLSNKGMEKSLREAEKIVQAKRNQKK